MDPYGEQAHLIKAMAHPSRLLILEVLTQGEACVCHLTAVLKHRQPNVSQHLSILRRAGLVKSRRDGVMIYYRLADDRIPQVITLTREILLAHGVEVEFPPVPAPPVEGCSCPRCGDGSSCY